jgi:hypothetical protein
VARSYSKERRPLLPDEPACWYEAHTREAIKANGYMPEWGAHVLLFDHVRALEEDQLDVHLQNVLNAQLYSNRELMAFDWVSQVATTFKPLRPNIENIIQSVVDTLRSRFSANRPRAKVMTQGADFDIYRKGRLLDRFVWGEFRGHKVWGKVDVMTKDALVYGTGWLKSGTDSDKTYIERVHPDEMVIDQRECVSDEVPLCMYRRKLIHRSKLLQMYGADRDAAEAIREAQSRGWAYTSFRSPTEDQIIVIEAHKRGPKGRHVIAIENYTLLDELYDEECFPYVWLKCREPETGFYGLPLVSDLMGYQIKQDETNELIRIAQHIMCVPRIFNERGADLQVSQFDNSMAKIYEYTGMMPQAMVWPGVNAEVYNERDRNRSAAYEYTGVSEAVANVAQMSSQDRFDSAPARREHIQLQDQRHNPFVQRIESVYMDLAERVIADNAKLYRGRKVDRSTSYLSHNLVQQIPWSEVDMERDRYVLELGAASVLSMSPAARTDKLETMLSEGKIDIQDYYSLSGDPDLERLTNRKAAKTDYVESMIDKMLDGKPQTPTAFTDLDVAIPMVSDELQRLLSIGDETEGTEVPADVIDCFVQWLELAKELKAPAITEPAMAPGVDEAQVAAGMPPGPPPPQGMGPTAPGMPPGPELGMTGVAIDPALAAQMQSGMSFDVPG